VKGEKQRIITCSWHCAASPLFTVSPVAASCRTTTRGDPSSASTRLPVYRGSDNLFWKWSRRTGPDEGGGVILRKRGGGKGHMRSWGVLEDKLFYDKK
jgi:hypothetical protein